MPNNKLHNKLWQMAFGNYDYPVVPVDKQVDEYSQKLPGIQHRRRDHDPLRAADYEDPEPEKDKWRIMYRFYHIASDWWWTKLSKEKRTKWEKKIKNGDYPGEINDYFWRIIDKIYKTPLGIYKILPWECELLPQEWEEWLNIK